MKTKRLISIFFYSLLTYSTITITLGILETETNIDPNIIANRFRLILGLLIIMFFIFNIKNIKFNLLSIFLMVYPILTVPIGVYFNGFSTIILADTFNALVFASLFITTINLNAVIRKIEPTIKRVAMGYFLVLLISVLLVYLVFPILNIQLTTVGFVPINFIIPLNTFLISNSPLLIIALLLLLLGRKRGVMITVIIIVSIYTLTTKSMKKPMKVFLTTLTILFIALFSYIIFDDQSYKKFPEEIQPVVYKFSQLSLVSNNSAFDRENENPRVVEVESALMKLNENPFMYLTGAGPGYTYEYSTSRVYEKERHNIHISPITLITRYGLLYTIILYGAILYVLVKNFSKKVLISSKFLDKFFYLYLLGALINSFTAFTIYSDYWFIISFGYLYSIRNNSYEGEKYGTNYISRRK